ncbi:DUF6302 family protein [Streptomyces sp. NPDC051172]|uniref:DUF6302 family protein n=1 Tax=Streptomyces sp. NPDC051172 TaxID=3155796 RepID=UPI003434C74D
MRQRLADPSLLDAAVEVQLRHPDPTATCLAVPLGGDRVAGQVTVKGWSQALDVLFALEGKPGFANLRDSTSAGSAIDASRIIRWGLNTLLEEPRHQAQMFGYHAAGVQAYTAEQNREDARIPVTEMPDLPHSPTVARIQRVLLGGTKDGYLADRHFVASLSEDDAHTLSTAAVINRLHLPNVVARLAERGIDQFLDLGCGLLPDFGTPVEELWGWSLADVVARHRETARVLYADHDRTLLGAFRMGPDEHPLGPEWVQGDIQYMEQFLTSGRVQHVLDFGRPIGVLLHDVLPWISGDDTVRAAMETLRDHLPPGSALSLTHATDLGDNPMTRFSKVFRKAEIDFTPRDAPFIDGPVGDWPLEPPGLVPPHRWHSAHPHAALDPQAAGALAGLAFKPAPIEKEPQPTTRPRPAASEDS